MYKMLMCVVLAGMVTLSGCSHFMPPVDGSYESSKEYVKVKMISCQDIIANKPDVDFAKRFKQDYNSVFDESYSCVKKDKWKEAHAFEALFNSTEYYDEDQDAMGEMGAVAAYLIGLGVDFVSSEMEKDAERYVAKYGKHVAFDGFYGRQGQLPSYCGFEISRYCGDKQTMSLVCGIFPSRDKSLYKVAPLSFTLNGVKAKVLSSGLGIADYYCLFIPFVCRYCFCDAQEEVGVDFKIVMTSKSIDDNGACKENVLGNLLVRFPTMKVRNPDGIHAASVTEDVREKLFSPSGWFFGPVRKSQIVERNVLETNDNEPGNKTADQNGKTQKTAPVAPGEKEAADKGGKTKGDDAVVVKSGKTKPIVKKIKEKVFCPYQVAAFEIDVQVTEMDKSNAGKAMEMGANALKENKDKITDFVKTQVDVFVKPSDDTSSQDKTAAEK